jgi:hypothetical protein
MAGAASFYSRLNNAGFLSTFRGLCYLLATMSLTNLRLKVLLLSFATAVITAAQTADMRTATLEGIVKNLKTGEPLADVRVTAAPEVMPGSLAPAPAPTATKTATTDAEGKFSITAMPPGRYFLSATRTLFFRPRRDAGPIAVTLTEGQRLTGIQVLLSPTAVIAGRVIDENREPLRSVRVEAVRREYRDGQRVWLSSTQSMTDDRGEYRLFNLTPGTYYVRATQSNTTTLYYPGVPDSQNAVPVSVEGGSEAAAIDIGIRRLPEYSVLLKLGGVPPGSPATFSIRRKNGLANEQQVARPESLPDNTYRLAQLPPGAYDILVQVSTPAAVQPRVLTHVGSIPVTVGNANEDLGTVSIPQTVSVTGRIVAPETLPSPLAPERLTVTLRALNLMTVIARSTTSPPGIAADGTFTLPNVAAGHYQVQLSGLPSETYLVSAREGAREVLDTGFTVSGTQNALELRVGGPGSVGSVTGVVVNAVGQPVPSSTVVLVPPAARRSNPSAFRTTTADQSGTFVIRSVIAGDYRLLAWEEIEPGIYMDPEFLKNFETRGEAIRVQPGSPSAVTVRIILGQ